MEQESTLISNKSIAIIGGGPAGCACAKFLQDYGFNEIYIFDSGEFLRTILPTGGGRCNFAHAEYEYKELSKNYPRGEKFLYSIFAKFATYETIHMFENLGIKSYTQEDGRIFPISNSSNDVREKFLKNLKCRFINEKVENIKQIPNGYKITTNQSTYAFDIVVAAIGGHSNFDLIKDLGISIIPPTPALVGLITEEDFSIITGVSIKNARINNVVGDFIFTHNGVSGPLIYTISSINARKECPYTLNIELAKIENLQTELNTNPHKEIKNLLAKYLPKSLAEYILNQININPETKCHAINGKMRDNIIYKIENFQITVIKKAKGEEVVTCGGIDLNTINPKTLEIKQYKNLYCCGEVMDIDGLCGGFNLQNCWSSAYIVAKSISESHLH